MDDYKICINLVTNAGYPVAQALDLFYTLCEELAQHMTQTEYLDFLSAVHAILDDER